MVAAFLDSWLTGDPETDECVLEFCKPGWAETASVACLAVRLHLGGPGTPRRYAWGQAIRRAVLAVLLVHAVLAVNVLVFLFGEPPSGRLAAHAAGQPSDGLARRRLAHGVLRGQLRLDRDFRDAGPGPLPRGPGTAYRNPGGRLTDYSGGYDHDVRNQELAAGQGHVRRFKHLSIGARGDGRLGQSAVQPVGRPLMTHARRRAHDKNPSLVDLETGMITSIRQRLDIIGRPRPGMVCQRDAHSLTSRRQPV